MNTKRIMLYLFLGLQTIFLNGCPFEFASLTDRAIKIEGSPNTFTIKPATGKVTNAVVLIENKDESKPCEVQWKIIAVRPIPAKNFQVTIGKCPDGFKQIIPPEGELFTPRKGQIYLIRILTDAQDICPLGTTWIAE